jgi:hypothetical protein
MTVTADGRGVVLPAGSRLLADVADRATLTGELSRALVGLLRPRTVHGPGRTLVDLAVAVADGGGRRFRLRLDRRWPWTQQLTTAFARCTALPQPHG